jgi:hypothetical protein
MKAKPGLDHRTEQQDWDGQDQAAPEALAEHLLVPRVIRVCAAMPSVIHGVHSTHRVIVFVVLVRLRLSRHVMVFCDTDLGRRVMVVLVMLMFRMLHLSLLSSSSLSSCKRSS